MKEYKQHIKNEHICNTYIDKLSEIVGKAKVAHRRAKKTPILRRMDMSEKYKTISNQYRIAVRRKKW